MMYHLNNRPVLVGLWGKVTFISILFLTTLNCNALVTENVLKHTNAYDSVIRYVADFYLYNAAMSSSETFSDCYGVKPMEDAKKTTDCQKLCNFFNQLQKYSSEIFMMFVFYQVNLCDWSSIGKQSSQPIDEPFQTTYTELLPDMYQRKVRTAYIVDQRIGLPQPEVCHGVKFLTENKQWTSACSFLCNVLYSVHSTADVLSIMPQACLNSTSVVGDATTHTPLTVFVDSIASSALKFLSSAQYDQLRWEIYKYRTATLLLTTVNSASGSSARNNYLLVEKFGSSPECKSSKSLNSTFMSDNECVNYCNIIRGSMREHVPIEVHPEFCTIPGITEPDVSLQLPTQQEANFYAYQLEIAVRQMVDVQLETYRTKIQNNSLTISQKCRKSTSKNAISSASCIAVCVMLEEVCDDECFSYIETHDVFDCTFGENHKRELQPIKQTIVATEIYPDDATIPSTAASVLAKTELTIATNAQPVMKSILITRIEEKLLTEAKPAIAQPDAGAIVARAAVKNAAKGTQTNLLTAKNATEYIVTELLSAFAAAGATEAEPAGGQPADVATGTKPAVGQPAGVATGTKPAIAQPAGLATGTKPAVGQPAGVATGTKPAIAQPAGLATETKPAIAQGDAETIGAEAAVENATKPTQTSLSTAKNATGSVVTEFLTALPAAGAAEAEPAVGQPAPEAIEAKPAIRQPAGVATGTKPAIALPASVATETKPAIAPRIAETTKKEPAIARSASETTEAKSVSATASAETKSASTKSPTKAHSTVPLTTLRDRTSQKQHTRATEAVLPEDFVKRLNLITGLETSSLREKIRILLDESKADNRDGKKCGKTTVSQNSTKLVSSEQCWAICEILAQSITNAPLTEQERQFPECRFGSAFHVGATSSFVLVSLWLLWFSTD